MKFNIEMTALELKAACENGTLLQMVGEVVDAGEGREIPKKAIAEKPAVPQALTEPAQPQQVKVETPQAPQPQQAPTVPTSKVSYTLDDLQRAGAGLMDKGLISELQNVIKELGVDSLAALPEEKYGDFATKIRELGADI